MAVIPPSSFGGGSIICEKPAGKFTTGCNGKLGNGVGSINRAPMETCPGMSEWCKSHCYARRGHFQAWLEEYRKPVEIPSVLPGCVRIHSSGDFDTVEYVRWCTQFVKDHSDVSFWSYTRSWRVDELLPELERLRGLDNMQLFASMDESINETPPEGWRVAWVEGDPRIRGIVCPHDSGVVESCSDCGICYEDMGTDVVFKKK